MKKVGVVLSGCGVYDGGEIHESVLTLLALDKEGAETICMAPDINQMHVVNHLTGKPVEGETRNVLIESARIARGNIKDIKNVNIDQIDALIFPGGFGAAKNLCNFAVAGEKCEVNQHVAQLVRKMVKAGKPVGAICISPAMIAGVFKNDPEIHPELTIGTDSGTGSKLEAMGSKHKNKKVDEIHVDKKLKIVSTPAYMLAGHIAEVEKGINKLVKEVLALV
ncbi:MAG: isoprenoid biosynthesis protein ElbB [Candidatus Schekmanbacteria bacterium RBG_13_48_7]|uniref:Isoprenoid biosynthesis protein ElbB n=1 Tax=Candidatus Schekmanbacteria bacterium RBG_13_48_7 TaxID=1817878 RepID=A0A1F7RQD0_9BACT|nr:MAG: isoprenoid biosynthesis protein ElbB [Candidatus Schekmanbacteria bacterium RBG_13_48_7]